jgi:hypothetical protein
LQWLTEYLERNRRFGLVCDNIQAETNDYCARARRPDTDIAQVLARARATTITQSSKASGTMIGGMNQALIMKAPQYSGYSDNN